MGNGEGRKGAQNSLSLQDIANHPHATIFVVEGEKDADRLAGLGLVATTASEGAESGPPTLTSISGAAMCAFYPTTSVQQVSACAGIARNLHGIAAKVRLSFDPLATKGRHK